MHAAAAAVGLLGDLVVGELPYRRHPVGVFGSAMETIERRCYADSRFAGVLFVGVGASLACAVAAVTRSTGLVTFVCAAPHGLADAARTVERPLLAGDIEGARAALPALVGRNPEGLEPDEVARAVIESVAENTVDAVIAPVFWACVLGARGAAVHRATNTLDAMVGHRSRRYQRFGWASARLDDVMAWVPARLTAVLVAVVRPVRAREIWRAVRDDAPAHPSPNSGVAEAAFAAALGLKLGGPTIYGDRVDVRPSLGSGRAPRVSDIDAAVRLARHVTQAAIAVLLAFGSASALVHNRKKRCRYAGSS